MNNVKKIFGLNIGIILTAIICYSPGFLNLRPADESIFKAGMSIVIFIFLVMIFCYGNLKLLKEPEKVVHTKESIKNLDTAREVIRPYKGGKYLGEIADTVIEQIGRIQKSTERAKVEIDNKFTRESLTWKKYYSAVLETESIALDNVISVSNKIQMFDERDYAKIKNYKHDNIPDDIQRKQFELYDDAMEYMQKAIKSNENIILGLDTLTLELSKPGEIEENNNSLLADIEKLTKEAKYYS